MSSESLINERKVFDGMCHVKGVIEKLGMSRAEKLVMLKNLAAHEENVIERENLAAAVFNALNSRGLDKQ